MERKIAKKAERKKVREQLDDKSTAIKTIPIVVDVNLVDNKYFRIKCVYHKR